MQSELSYSPPEGGGYEPSTPSLPGYDFALLLAYTPDCVLYLAKSQTDEGVRNVTCYKRHGEAAEQRFAEALKLQKRLEGHDDIEKITETVASEGWLFAISEPVVYPMLQEVLIADGPKPLAWVVRLCSRIAFAIDFVAAQTNGAHGYLCPNSIRLDPAGDRFTLLHYMFVSLAQHHVSAYCAPEVAAGASPTLRSDLYSMGAIVYACRTGQPPYFADNDAALITQIKSSCLPALPEEPGYVRAVTNHLTARSPDDRYRRAVDAANDLKAHRSPLVLLKQKPHGKSRTKSRDQDFNEDSYSPLADETHTWQGHGALPALHALLTAAGNIARKPFAGLADWNFKRTHRRPAPVTKFRRTAVRMFGGCRYVGVRAMLVLLVATACHAGYVVSQQRYITVAAVTGGPQVTIVRQVSPVNVGDRIDSADLPVIHTAKHDAVTIVAADSQIHLEPGTALKVRRMEIEGVDRIRVFELVSGQVSVLVPGLYTPQSRFEVVYAGIRVRIKSGRVRISGSDGRSNVQVQDGSVDVLAGDRRTVLTAGKQAFVTGDGETRFAAVPAQSLHAIVSQTVVPFDPPLIGSLVGRYHALEEQRLVPAANRIMEMVHLKPTSSLAMQNAKALTTARMALTVVSEAIAEEHSPPSRLNLQTLEETSLDEDAAKGVVTAFEGHKLLAYYRMSSTAYIIFARANDSNHTLIRLENGSVSAISEEDEAIVLSKARKKWHSATDEYVMLRGPLRLSAKPA